MTGIKRIIFIIHSCNATLVNLAAVSYIIDAGAEVSVIPPTQWECKHHCTAISLQAENNTSIATYGNRSFTLDLGLRLTFQWIFIVADVKHPILGADFLRSYNLLVDIKHERLSDTLTQLKVQGITSQIISSPGPCILSQQTTAEFRAILSEFPDVIQLSTSGHPSKNGVIVTKDPPVCARPRRLSPEHLRIA